MKDIVLVASGDLRPAANRDCWPAQAQLEEALTRAVGAEGYRLERAHAYDPDKGHGFIESQRRGLEVFRQVDPAQPLVVAFAAWQYSQHLLPGLLSHEAPLLMMANWSGEWPGLVGMLNMNGSLAKAGKDYSTLWGEDFTDETFRAKLRRWLEEGRVEHNTSHVHPASGFDVSGEAAETGRRLARELREEKALMGVFDEGCMGMYNAIIPDALLHETGVFKERLSQSALYHETTQVSNEEARRCREWLDERGMTFHTGSDPETELTDEQILGQLKMYIAALRMADDFGCDVIGIQYQQGLKDLLPASDLAEGLLNNTERPPVYARNGHARNNGHTRSDDARGDGGAHELFAGRALPHFNEVDEGAGLDALVTHRVWTALGLAPETTLHDLRWGQSYEGDYVWVFEISGAVPPAHLGGYEQAESHRQPPMFFPNGGGTIKGYAKPGEIVWSRVYVEADVLKADLGRGRAVELPAEEAERRSRATNPEWPIMHAVTYGTSRDQMMARHKSNHVQVAYAPDTDAADRALTAKIAMFEEMGLETYVCGTNPLTPSSAESREEREITAV